MNPWLLTACVLGQIAWLYSQGPAASAATWALALALVYSCFAWTRLRWGAHLDMHLIMLGPGSLAMLLPEILFGLSCPLHSSWTHLWWMSISMLAVALPWTWFQARCFAQAKIDGEAWPSVAADAIGMQLGMGLVHGLGSLVPAGMASKLMLAPELPWVSHSLMLLAMSVGMAAGTYARLELRNASRRPLRSSL